MNKYLIESEIGKGKFGIVYKGSIRKNGKPVAIKMEQKQIATLRYEATILQYLTKSGIDCVPSVHWYGIYRDHKYLVMDYYDMTLQHYADALFKKYGHNEKTATQMDKVFDRMVEIVSMIHRCKIIHRDIKPDNFMIRDSEIYLIDFGMATAVSDDTLSKEQLHVVGTPTWMSYFVHDGYSPHYRDDLISVGYIYLSWYGVLPWIKMESSTGKMMESSTGKMMESSTSKMESSTVKMDTIIDYSDIRHPSHQMRKKYKTWLNIEMLCMNHKIRDFLYKLYHS
jgi:serine/threonine protein kinase